MLKNVSQIIELQQIYQLYETFQLNTNHILRSNHNQTKYRMKLPPAIVSPQSAEVFSQRLLTKILFRTQDLGCDTGVLVVPGKWLEDVIFIKSFLCSFSVICLLFLNFYVCQTTYIHTCANIYRQTHIFYHFLPISLK